MRINNVLISVCDKTDLILFAQGLVKINPDIHFIATADTALFLREGGIEASTIHEITGYPECFGGKVRTLHPAIIGGILHQRGLDDAEAVCLGTMPIDLVVTSLPNFPQSDLLENTIYSWMEQIDIDTSLLIKSAIKNYLDVGLLVDPSDYPLVIKDLDRFGDLTLETREELITKALSAMLEYETQIADEFGNCLLAKEAALNNAPKQEKPSSPSEDDVWTHQFDSKEGIKEVKSLTSKEMSHTNYSDATLAYNTVQLLAEFKEKIVFATVKGGELVGLSVSNEVEEALILATSPNPIAAIGSVVATNANLTSSLLPMIKDKLIEVLIAPSFSPHFIKKTTEELPYLRLIELPNGHPGKIVHNKGKGGGLLIHPLEKKFPRLSEILPPTRGKNLVGKAPNDLLELFLFGYAATHFATPHTVAISRRVGSDSLQLITKGESRESQLKALEEAMPKGRLIIARDPDPLEEDSSPREEECLLEGCALTTTTYEPEKKCRELGEERGLLTCQLAHHLLQESKQIRKS